MSKEVDELLFIDEEDISMNIEEFVAIKPIIKDFIESYVKNKDMPVDEWLGKKLQEIFTEKSLEEIQEIADEIITTIRLDEDNKNSLTKAITSGRSKESWFASEMKKITSSMSSQEASNYLLNLDIAMVNVNKSLHKTITTKSGIVSQNPRLDGFIAEQYHAQTFNLNAETRGSQYRAKVLEPNGSGYTKNSVDIEILNGNGKIVKRYQSKYCKDAKATARAFEQGDYRGQQKLVPDGQQIEIKKKSTIVLEAPDGTTSNPLSKSKAEFMRDEAQRGQLGEFDWNEYKAKDLARGIGKQVSYAAFQGVLISAGVEMAQKLWAGKQIDGEEVIETAIVSGVDFGLKVAVGGALKAGAEKGIITLIPKGTPVSTIANIAFVAVEDVKVVGKMATGELSFKEGIDKIEQTTVATAVGLATMLEGAEFGVAAGTIFGPAGSAIGGFIGGTVGYMAGSTFGETLTRCKQKLMDGVLETTGYVLGGLANLTETAFNVIDKGVSSILGLFW